LVARCRVEFERPAGRVVAETEDLSLHGVFIRTDQFLPIGELTRLLLTLPDERQLSFSARVTHIRLPAAARALGRRGGMGLELRGQGPAFEGLSRFLDTVRKDVTTPAISRPTQAVVAEPGAELRARLIRCLSGAGFQVSAFESALEVIAASASSRPDIVVAATEMTPMNGIELAHAMAEHRNLLDVPLLLIGEDAADMVRLEAYRAGVSDFVPMPFLDEELVIRVSRVVVPSTPTSALRGNLEDVGIGTLLSLFEFERKSGVLLVLRPGELMRAFLFDGAIFKIESGDVALSPRARVMSLLDWHQGRFEFSSAPVAGVNEVGVSTTTLLLEHARLRDETLRVE
jgi:CheY-like chemotaxis protein/Tfp pilus assembly protein PilZ